MSLLAFSRSEAPAVMLFSAEPLFLYNDSNNFQRCDAAYRTQVL